MLVKTSKCKYKVFLTNTKFGMCMWRCNSMLTKLSTM